MDRLFAKYLNKQQFNKTLLNAHVPIDLKLIIIIPAYNEPDILLTLNSLKNCEAPKHVCEVIVLINDSETSPSNIKNTNAITFNKINTWIESNTCSKLTFHCIYERNLPKKHAGAGLARKLAMDEAIRRFYTIQNTDGIIASLDADTLVSENYLNDIQKSFEINKKQNCAIFQFEHPIKHNILPEQTNAIVLYEMYLRYFKQCLAYAGFPFAYHTIGSCFAVKADAYVKQGGMNRRQGAEDFYFLHKIFPLGGVKELANVTVYPSSRISDRVPFGTGPALAKILNDGNYYTYNPIYFNYLKHLFENSTDLFRCNEEIAQSYHAKLHESLRSFITLNEFTSRINEINSNSSSIKTFTSRFFNWFDAFKIIKYMNFIHSNENRISILNACLNFFELIGFETEDKSEISILNALRIRDKESATN